MLCPVDLRPGAQRGVPVYGVAGVRLRVRDRQRQRGEVGGREGERQTDLQKSAEVRVERGVGPLPSP
jgi:hypothetical protein